MEPNDTERRDLAERVTSERIQRHGTRLNAYAAAKVNSSVWTKIENGQPVAERSLIAVVKHLWPETGGDWRKLVPPLGDSRTLRDVVKDDPDLSPEARADILAILEREAQQPEPPTPGRERGVS